MKLIPKFVLSKLPFYSKEIKATILNNQLVIGPHIEKLEQELSNIFGFVDAVTVSNGSSALFLAIKALGIEKSNIIVPSVSTCQAITNAVLSTNNTPIFCDLCERDFTLDEKELEHLIGKIEISLIIAPSHFGVPAQISRFRKFGIPIIEDACQAFLTRSLIKSEADILILSFYPTKQFNCIEGGAILVRDENLSNLLKDTRYFDNQNEYDGKMRYNMRMPNLNAAIGLVQLKKISRHIEDLISIKNIYEEGVMNKSILNDSLLENNTIPWRYMVKGLNRDQISALSKIGYTAASEFSWVAKGYPDYTVNNLINNQRSLPYHADLDRFTQDLIIKTINKWN